MFVKHPEILRDQPHRWLAIHMMRPISQTWRKQICVPFSSMESVNIYLLI